MDSLSPTNAPGSSNSLSSNSNITNNRKPPAFRNLQPRAAARMDFNDNLDNSDDEADGILSADYIAQRKTTQDLVDFFRSAPPPSPPQQQQNVMTPLVPIFDDEKKKKPLLQWLRPKKSGSNLNGSSITAGGGSTLVGTLSGRNSMLVQGTAGATSNMSTVSGVTMGKGKNGEDITTSTLPNGRKYIMIAVDYKEGDGGGADPSQRSAGSGGSSDVLSISNGSFMTTTRLPNGGTVSSRRQSRVPDDVIVDGLNLGATAKRMSILSSTLGNDLGLNGGGEKRRSILQTSGTTGSIISTNGSKFVLGGGSFLLENFALDTDFMGQGVSSVTGGGGGGGGGGASGGSGGVTGAGGAGNVTPSEMQNSASNKSGGEGAGLSRSGSKRSGNKVKFSILDGATAGEPPMDESIVAEALAQRLASHKAQQQAKPTTTTTAATTTTDSGQQDFPEIILPKPVSRKKVRHVQIQTQHCVMRTMHTQTEPYDSLAHDLDIKEWSSAPQSISESTEVESTTSTVAPGSSCTTPLNKKDASTSAVTSARPNSKVASLVASLTQPTAATTATTTTLATRSTATSPTTTSPPSPFPNSIDGIQAKSLFPPISTSTSTDPSSPDPVSLREELALLRDQNAILQQKVSSLQRDLAAETRARNRTAVAMQDTRDKFEMLSAMAFKKLKEMIFQRHVLEMEVRELRAQVDLSSEVNVVKEGEMLFRQEQQQQQQQLMLQQQQQCLYQTA
ncbi:hypothetical protein BGZ95_001013 [Linnemannia exigua]|uniref:Uncharacterized protein n=1 Tax=Linnemannia exigua TaxID=604196 RepID=A0AAD4DP26_9FUNG|nr:hypothetical protein BGZ95_001013 [Linnemannia exigua]